MVYRSFFYSFKGLHSIYSYYRISALFPCCKLHPCSLSYAQQFVIFTPPPRYSSPTGLDTMVLEIQSKRGKKKSVLVINLIILEFTLIIWEKNQTFK